ncbi:PIN domain-like protein [Armillaria luteobubalina]|uniref:PIN domain-like protein n=1 Tax=Armillaria luteobubalina TaxID=153913 RepID=A0AA39PL60_9AGAR|nr:PIN domain-like protein [Armillaria luteobubalina]
MLWIGIDASIWIVQCEAIFWGPQHAQAGENLELHTLLFCVAHLLQCALIPVFVFDGKLHPSMKCGKKAPGEAEAELAHMNQAGIIDAIITEDNDVLIFGAKLILCRPSGLKTGSGKKAKADSDLYNLYLADHICSSENIQLMQGRLFLFAILLGGDYANGLQGCGQKTTHVLCQTDLGDSLLTAVTVMGPIVLDNFLVGWRMWLQSELLNPTIGRASRCLALENKLPDDFLNPQVLRLYALPVTSWSIQHTPPNAEQWKPPLPDISRIAIFCDSFFHWEPDVWLKCLHKNVWPGIVIHSLYQMSTLSKYKPA